MLCFRCGSYNSDDAQKCTVCGQELVDKAGKNIGPQKRPTTGQQQALIFSPGELIAGRYRILELIGQGGVGAVYRARDTEVDVDVALKGISPNLLQTDEEQKQFSKAIKAARKLQHPNIVRIYDEAQHLQPNRRFFTMKLLEGLTLRKIIRLRHDKSQAFSPEELTPIFHQLGAALDYAHKQTWHGDLKPENVVVLPDLLKVTDFNLVKSLPLKPFLGIAKSRSKAFPYIAPELRVEAQSIDGRVDIYSLGVIFAEMLTGIVYEGHFSRAFTAALEQLPTRLDGLIRRAIAEHPDGRFAKAGEMAKEIEAALNALGGQPLPPPVLVKEAPNLSKPPASPGAALGPAPKPPAVQPPSPPPLETNPVQALLSSSSPEDDPSLLEIGQSQVLLLESAILDTSGVNKPGRPFAAPVETDMELAARRLMSVAGLNPDDTADDTTMRGASVDESDTNPGGRLRKGKPARPGLVSAETPAPVGDGLLRLDANEDDDKLIPPPLPNDEGDPLERSHFPLPDDEAPTVENRQIAAGNPNVRPGRAPVAASSENPGPNTAPRSASKPSQDSLDQTAGGPIDAHASAADLLELTSDEPPYAAPPGSGESEAGLAIHDALTALKLHPRPDLVEDLALREALTRTAAGAAAEEQELPPALPVESERDDDLDDDSLQETMTSDARDEAMPPPIQPFIPLRPVAPPRKPKHSANPIFIAAGVGVVVLLLLLGGRKVWKQSNDDPEDIAGVTVQPDEPVMAKADAGVVAVAVVDAGVPPLVAAVDEAALLRKRQEAEALAEAARREREAALKVPDPKVPDPKVPDPKVPDPKVPDPKVPDPKVPDPKVEPKVADAKVEPKVPDPEPKVPDEPKPPVVALASGECPGGTVKIEAGSFTFGSSQSDPMRNFGEADATAVEVKTFCIEHYEAPNGKSSLPTTGVSWTAAKNACERAGRRLCTEQEWERACKGPSSSRFPYGNSYDASLCNTEDADGKPRPLAAPVDFKKCKSGFRLYMMAGNAEEWVADSSGGQKIAKGGSASQPDFASRCSARHVVSGKTSSPTLGYRCCADPR